MMFAGSMTYLCFLTEFQGQITLRLIFSADPLTVTTGLLQTGCSIHWSPNGVHFLLIVSHTIIYNCKCLRFSSRFWFPGTLISSNYFEQN